MLKVCPYFCAILPTNKCDRSSPWAPVMPPNLFHLMWELNSILPINDIWSIKHVRKSAYYNVLLEFYNAVTTSAITKYCVIWFNSAFRKLGTTYTHINTSEGWWGEVFTKISWNSILGKTMTLQERSPQSSPRPRRPSLMWPRPPLSLYRPITHLYSGVRLFVTAWSFHHEASASTALCIYMYLNLCWENPLSSCPSN